ncbi:MAG: XdhC family protein [archaeon GBS-70-058]|nr:XdhC family protein [Candidatus Culexarchaeum nevadense]
MNQHNSEIFQEIVKALREGERVALCIVIEKKGSGPRNIGAKMIVHRDGRTVGSIGGGKIERIIVEEALKALNENESKTITLSLGEGEGIETGLICGGSIKIFIDILNPNPKLIVVGSGNVAKPLTEIASMVGFEVTIVDDNANTATKDRFPTANKIIVNENLMKGLDEANPNEESFITIVHGDVKKEYEVLKRVLRGKIRYIGLLGSRRKGAELKKKLIEEGFKEEDVEKIRVPIGIDINAETPEEIAVSIVAELIMNLRCKK